MNKTIFFRYFLIFTFLGFALGMLGVQRFSTVKSAEPTPAKVEIISPPVSYSFEPKPKYSDEELKGFWNARLDGLIKSLFTFQTPYPEINDRFRILSGLMSKKYGSNLEVSLSPTYHTASQWISDACQLKAGKPLVDIIVPTHMDIYDRLVSKFGLEEGMRSFQVYALVGFIHECDHLAFGYVEEGDKSEIPIEKLVFNESHAWAETCEHCIRPLVEKGAPLGESELAYYKAWVDNGRSAESNGWKLFILRAYKTTTLVK